MSNWFKNNFRAIIYVSFLVPIITVAVVSISHVTGWYGLSNPLTWSVYLSIGIEIAALSALAAISAEMGSKVYLPFGIVTIIQFVGNIFFAFEYIQITDGRFLSWVELVGPILEYVNIEAGDLQSHRRFLAIFSGGMLPLISLSFLHMLVKFNEETAKTKLEVKEETKNNDSEEIKPIDASELMSEVSRVRPTEEELNMVEDILKTKTPETPKNRPTKEKQRELLEEIMKNDQEMGLYDEPYMMDETSEIELHNDDLPPLSEYNSDETETTPLDDLKEFFNRKEPTKTPKTASEMMITKDLVVPDDEEPSDWDLPVDTEMDIDLVDWDETISDGLEEEDWEPVNEEINEIEVVDEEVVNPQPTPRTNSNLVVKEPITDNQDKEVPEKKN